MPLNIDEVLGEAYRIESEAKQLLDAALKTFKEKYRYAPLPVKPSYKFILVNPEKIDRTDLLRRMAQFSGWANYYNARASQYKAVVDYLDSLHDSLTKQYIATSTAEKSDRKRECAARARYSPVLRASQIARVRFQEYLGRQELATQQYTLCSRVITYQGDAMRSG